MNWGVVNIISYICVCVFHLFFSRLCAVALLTDTSYAAFDTWICQKPLDAGRLAAWMLHAQMATLSSQMDSHPFSGLSTVNTHPSHTLHKVSGNWTLRCVCVVSSLSDTRSALGGYSDVFEPNIISHLAPCSIVSTSRSVILLVLLPNTHSSPLPSIVPNFFSSPSSFPCVDLHPGHSLSIRLSNHPFLFSTTRFPSSLSLPLPVHRFPSPSSPWFFVVCHSGMLTLWQCRPLNNWCGDVKVWCLTRGQIEPAGTMPLPISRLPALCATQHFLFYTETHTHTHLSIQYTYLPMDSSTSSLKLIVKPLRYLLQDSVTVTQRNWLGMCCTFTTSWPSTFMILME